MHYEHERDKPKFPAAKLWWPPPEESLWEDFYLYLLGRELDPDLARLSGWYPATLRQSPCIIMPCTPTIFWQARFIDPQAPKRYDSPGVSRGASLIFLHPPRAHTHSLVTEGPMDALAAAEFGYKSIALMGNKPTSAMLDLTKTLLYGTMALLLEDRDSIGSLSYPFGELSMGGIPCRLTSCPSPYKDLAQMPRDKRERFLERMFKG